MYRENVSNTYQLRTVLRPIKIIVKTVLVLFCLLPTASFAAEPSREIALPTRPLTIGKVSSNPKKHYRYLKPMAEYVVERMKDLGITEAKVLMAKNNRQMVSYLKQNKVDWVTETASSAVTFEDKAGAELLVRKWKKGVPEYHTIFFARKDSGIRTLHDLRGKTIAFQDLGSTSAYVVPAAILIEKGLELTQLASPREKPPSDMVGYIFSKEEINTSTWVHKGLVDAGAYNNLDWNREDQLPPSVKNDLEIFHISGPIPRAFELVRKDLDPRIRQRLKQILLNAHTDPDAGSILRAYQKTEKFDELNEQIQRELQQVRKSLKIVRSTLE